jgi:solute carrier family 35 protein F1/2
MTTQTSYRASCLMRKSPPSEHMICSCSLFFRWAIPICLFFSWLYMRTKYHWTQILVSVFSRIRVSTHPCSQGVFVCVAGLGLLVFSDHLTDKNDHAWNKSKGDAFMIAGATLYGICESRFSSSTILSSITDLANATEEWFVRRSPLYEVCLFIPECVQDVTFLRSIQVVGQMGMWGALICGTQAACLEHGMMKTAPWNAFTSQRTSPSSAPSLLTSWIQSA